MKRKAILITAILLLLAVGAFCAFLIYDSYNYSEEMSTDEMLDIPTQITENEDSAFAFLKESDNVLPDNMRGYVVDMAVDISFDDTTEAALKAEAESIFEKVDAILPNTVVIKYSDNINYAPSGFDVLSYFTEKAKEQELYVVMLLDGEEFPINKTGEKEILEKTGKYNVNAVMLDVSEETGDISKKVQSIKDGINQKDIKFGIFCQDSPNESIKNLVINSATDFCFVQLNYSTENGVENIIKQWAAIGLSCNSPVYGILRNDLVRSSTGWTQPTEIYEQVRLLYNNGGFSGCVMHSHAKLRTDDNQTATKLFSYNESFNDSDYTALIFTDVEIKNNEEIIFYGTTDKNYPLHVWCTANGKWQQVSTQGDEGNFAVSIPLSKGENKVVVKHKNARYTYFIDRAVDVMSEYSAVVDGNKAVLTVKAVKDAKVYASLANTVLVELEATGAETDGYITYSATYELKGWLRALTSDDISYAAVYGGINDIVMCGKEKALSPYDNHGLGTATICRVERDYAETTSSTSNEDISDPTCTPQLAGAYGYVQDVGVCENKVLLYLNSGMKLYCASTRLILDGFVLPDNSVNLESVNCSEETSLEFSFNYNSFIQTVIAPQKYYKGYLQRIYNVEEFSAEYVDILFMNTTQCSYDVEPDFSASNVIERAEWYSNAQEKFMTLRLYLKNKGDFGGYSFERCDNGNIKISLKKKAEVLSGTVIMLDPGHGGYGAPGTNSNMNIYEKEVTLAIALQTAQILRNHGATVIMTRTDDKALSLSERAGLIREYEPDIFVSIHNDGSEDVSWYGTHTFYYKNFSMPLAGAIHKQMVNAYRTYYYTDPASEEYTAVDKGIKFYPFLVTRVEECPSVLIECGYLTNAVDSVFLTDSNGQLILATAIAQGIVDYIAE